MLTVRQALHVQPGGGSCRSEIRNAFSGTTFRLGLPLDRSAFTETLQYLRSFVAQGGLGRPAERQHCSSYTAVETLWKVETTVSKVSTRGVPSITFARIFNTSG
jgi:hypothetical protein